jgi:hypothetical protein
MVIWFRLIAGNLIGSGGAMGSPGAASEPAVKAAREIANCRRVNLPLFTSLSILSIVSIMSDLLHYRLSIQIGILLQFIPFKTGLNDRIVVHRKPRAAALHLRPDSQVQFSRDPLLLRFTVDEGNSAIVNL